MRHEAVMVAETVAHLIGHPAGLYIDGTVGQAGHATRILSELSAGGRLWGFDWDAEMLKYASTALCADRRVQLFNEGFSRIGGRLAARGAKADGILLDLGLNSAVLDDADRGFLHKDPDAVLDMRMDRARPLTAAEVIARYSEPELERVFREYGESRKPAVAARAIVQARRRAPIEHAGDLIGVLRRARAVPGGPAELSRIWQALRYEVNQELVELADFIRGVHDWITSGGRLCVISYESISDRMVKSLHKRMGGGESFRLVTGHVVKPARDEVLRNPRARSAKLRVMERMG